MERSGFSRVVIETETGRSEFFTVTLFKTRYGEQQTPVSNFDWLSNFKINYFKFALFYFKMKVTKITVQFDLIDLY